MTRCEFALWRRSYRRISTSDYLAGRLRFQIGIRIANAPIGKVLWTYCRRGMVERGCTRRGTEAFDCTAIDQSARLETTRGISRFIYLLLISIGRSFADQANRRARLARHRALSIATDDLCKSRLQLFAAFTLRVTLLLLPQERPLRYIYLQYGCPWARVTYPLDYVTNVNASIQFFICNIFIHPCSPNYLHVYIYIYILSIYVADRVKTYLFPITTAMRYRFKLQSVILV